MAVRGQVAKENVFKKIAQAFGSDYIDVIGGKGYVWAQDSSGKVQICISLTCPKTEVDSSTKPVLDFTEKVEKPKLEVTEDEMENIARLMKELNL